MNQGPNLAFFEERFNLQYEGEREDDARSWDRRAAEWDRKYRSEAESSLHQQRITDVAGWLRGHGLLTEKQRVADIGCGPGRFVAEFAKTAGFVLGTDLSPKMTGYGEAYCAERKLSNTAFVPVDFPNADIAVLGWEKQFDLVFASITPAVSGTEGLDRMLRMSRAWCFHASFLSNRNPLHHDLMQELFGRLPHRERIDHSQRLYELFSLLWLRGYYPETTYYRQHKALRIPADAENAQRLAEFLLEESELTRDNLERILRFLEQRADADGYVTDESESMYAWLLWDVRETHGA